MYGTETQRERESEDSNDSCMRNTEEYHVPLETRNFNPKYNIDRKLTVASELFIFTRMRGYICEILRP